MKRSSSLNRVLRSLRIAPKRRRRRSGPNQLESLESRVLLTDPFGGGGSDPGGGSGGSGGSGGPTGGPGGGPGGGGTPGTGLFTDGSGVELRPIGQQWFNNFGTEPLTGATALARDLPGGLGLEYRSDTDGLPIVIADTKWDQTSAPIGPIEARLLVDGVQHSSVFLDGASVSQGDEIRVALAVTTELATGEYEAEIQFIADVGAGSTTTSVTQQLLVENRASSEFGIGWTLAGVEQLYDDPGNGTMYVNGSGLLSWFPFDPLQGYGSGSGSMSTSSLVENNDGTFSLTHANGTTSQFDTSGLLTSRADSIGNTTTFTRDMTGVITSVTDMYGRVTDLVYQSGLLESVTDWANETLDIVHNASDELISITANYFNGAGPQTPAVTNYTYNTDGQVDSITESIYLLTSLSYDAGGRLSQADLPGGASWTFDPAITQAFVDPSGTTGTSTNPAAIFDPANAKATWTDPLSGVQEHVVDSTGYVNQTIAADGMQIDYVRDSNGLITSETLPDPDGAGPLSAPVTTHTFDANQLKTQTVHPGGATESWTWDTSLRLPLTHTDPDGEVTTYVWNSNRTLASITDVMGAVTSYTYDSYGNMLTQTLPDPDGAGPLSSTVLTYTRDAYGRATSVAAGGVTTSSTYDSLGRVTSETDGLGNTTSYVWNALGRIESVTYPDPDDTGVLTAPVESFTYDWYGRPLTETAVNGVITEYAYDSAGLLASVTVKDPDGAGPLTDIVTSWLYDDLDRPVTETDALGNATTTTYDAVGRVLTTTLPDPDGVGPLTAPVTTFTYDDIGRLESTTDALSNTTSYEYDAAGNLTKTTDALSDSVTSAFDILGRVTSTTDPLGNVTSYTYDKLGRVLTATLPDPDGAGPLSAPISTSSYDTLGQLISYTGFNGGITTTVYDGLGQVTSMTYPDGSTTSYTYNANGQVLTVTGADPDGAGPLVAPISSMTYDNLRRRIHQISPDSTIITNVYDDNGLIASMRDGEGRTTHYGYDLLGRRDQATDPSGVTTSVAYDTLGRVISTTDGLGNTSTIAYDNLGRITVQTDPLSGSTTTSYDGLGRVVSLVDSAGNMTSWTYDPLGRLLSDTNARGDTRNYSYNSLGQLLSRIDRNGREIEFAYDALGRQLSQQWKEGAATVNSTSISYSDDQHVSSITDDDSSYTFTWDDKGQLLTVDNSNFSGLVDVTLSSTYDALGRQTEFSAEIDGVLDFVNSQTFDLNSRVTSISQVDGAVSSGDLVSEKRIDLTYDDSNRLTSIVRYGDLAGTQQVSTSLYTYDTEGRPTALDHLFNSTTISSYSWVWNTDDLLTSYTSLRDGGGTFNYDANGQLTNASRTDLQSNTVTLNYNYDANGNRTSAGLSGLESTYTVLTNNLIGSDGVFDYEYDAEGNLVKKTSIASGDYSEYDWNHANLLTNVVFRDSVGNPSKTVTFSYDGLGRRTAKAVDETGDGTIDRSLFYVYDGAGLLASSAGSVGISGPNGVLAQHGWVDDLVLVFEDADGDGPIQPTLTSRLLNGPLIDQLFAQETADGEVLWALTDLQGSVRDWVEFADFDNDGTEETELINHLSLDSFGGVIEVTDVNGAVVDFDPRLAVTPGYTGQIFDADVGLLYFRSRWYSASLGQFLSDDPKGFAAGDANVRRLMHNNPTIGADPTGLFYGPPQARRVNGLTASVGVDQVRNPAPQTQHPDPPTYIDGVGQVFSGYGTALYNIGAGGVYTIMHPIDTINGVGGAIGEGVGVAISQPIDETLIDVGTGIWETGVGIYDTFDHGSLDDQGEIIMDVLVSAAPASKAKEVAKLAKRFKMLPGNGKGGKPNVPNGGRPNAPGGRPNVPDPNCFVAGTKVVLDDSDETHDHGDDTSRLNTGAMLILLGLAVGRTYRNSGASNRETSFKGPN